MSDWLEATFQTQRPKALAALTRYFRDVEIAEEAFSEACVKTLVDWPKRDVFVNRHGRIQRVILKDHRDIAVSRGIVVHDRFPDRDDAVADLFKTGDQLQCGRLWRRTIA